MTTHYQPQQQQHAARQWLKADQPYGHHHFQHHQQQQQQQQQTHHQSQPQHNNGAAADNATVMYGRSVNGDVIVDNTAMAPFCVMTPDQQISHHGFPTPPGPTTPTMPGFPPPASGSMPTSSAVQQQQLPGHQQQTSSHQQGGGGGLSTQQQAQYMASPSSSHMSTMGPVSHLASQHSSPASNVSGRPGGSGGGNAGLTHPPFYSHGPVPSSDGGINNGVRSASGRVVDGMVSDCIADNGATDPLLFLPPSAGDGGLGGPAGINTHPAYMNHMPHTPGSSGGGSNGSSQCAPASLAVPSGPPSGPPLDSPTMISGGGCLFSDIPSATHDATFPDLQAPPPNNNNNSSFQPFAPSGQQQQQLSHLRDQHGGPGNAVQRRTQGDSPLTPAMMSPDVGFVSGGGGGRLPPCSLRSNPPGSSPCYVGSGGGGSSSRSPNTASSSPAHLSSALGSPLFESNSGQSLTPATAGATTNNGGGNGAVATGGPLPSLFAEGRSQSPEQATSSPAEHRHTAPGMTDTWPQFESDRPASNFGPRQLAPPPSSTMSHLTNQLPPGQPGPPGPPVSPLNRHGGFACADTGGSITTGRQPPPRYSSHVVAASPSQHHPHLRQYSPQSPLYPAPHQPAVRFNGGVGGPPPPHLSEPGANCSPGRLMSPLAATNHHHFLLPPPPSAAAAATAAVSASTAQSQTMAPTHISGQDGCLNISSSQVKQHHMMDVTPPPQSRNGVVQSFPFPQPQQQQQQQQPHQSMMHQQHPPRFMMSPPPPPTNGGVCGSPMLRHGAPSTSGSPTYQPSCGTGPPGPGQSQRASRSPAAASVGSSPHCRTSAMMASNNRLLPFDAANHGPSLRPPLPPHHPHHPVLRFPPAVHPHPGGVVGGGGGLPVPRLPYFGGPLPPPPPHHFATLEMRIDEMNRRLQQLSMRLFHQHQQQRLRLQQQQQAEAAAAAAAATNEPSTTPSHRSPLPPPPPLGPLLPPIDLNLWWDGFTNEFFTDDARMLLTFCLEDGPRRYNIGRALIGRYFRSMFDGGVTELRYDVRGAREISAALAEHGVVTLHTDQCTVVTFHVAPSVAQVLTEARLTLDFAVRPDSPMLRIKTWSLTIRRHRELIPRAALFPAPPLPQPSFRCGATAVASATRGPSSSPSISANNDATAPRDIAAKVSFSESGCSKSGDCSGDGGVGIADGEDESTVESTASTPVASHCPTDADARQQQHMRLVETMAKNITRAGMTSATLNYLRLCVILEPMQELMSRHKTYGLAPRDCLKSTLFRKWQKSVALPAPGGATGASGSGVGGTASDSVKPTPKRRKRKTTASAASSSSSCAQSVNSHHPSPSANGNNATASSGQTAAGAIVAKSRATGTSSGVVAATLPLPQCGRKRVATHHSLKSDVVCSGSGGGGGDVNQATPLTPATVVTKSKDFSLASHEVMVVGEPSLMGGEFGVEDERLISRLENIQFDARQAAAAISHSVPPQSPAKCGPVSRGPISSSASSSSLPVQTVLPNCAPRPPTPKGRSANSTRGGRHHASSATQQQQQQHIRLPPVSQLMRSPAAHQPNTSTGHPSDDDAALAAAAAVVYPPILGGQVGGGDLGRRTLPPIDVMFHATGPTASASDARHTDDR